ncbi:protein transport protein Sec22 [Pisolithus microcarpus]|nr:protein transport protein Sec22 [Pisolithus microcarpus]
MVRSTLIVRASDALPLAASVDDEQTEQTLQEHKQQAKLIFRRITPHSEPKCSIESCYLLADNVVYLTIADQSYPRKFAFSYLEELEKEFSLSYGPKVESVRKPYAFVGFDTFMSKTARLYRDTRAASASRGSNLDKLNDELQDVTRIMTKNIEELLQRGDSLDSECKFPTYECRIFLLLLRTESEKYRRAARNVNVQAMIRQYAPFLVIALLFEFNAGPWRSAENTPTGLDLNGYNIVCAWSGVVDGLCPATVNPFDLGTMIWN